MADKEGADAAAIRLQELLARAKKKTENNDNTSEKAAGSEAVSEPESSAKKVPGIKLKPVRRKRVKTPVIKTNPPKSQKSLVLEERLVTEEKPVPNTQGRLDDLSQGGLLTAIENISPLVIKKEYNFNEQTYILIEYSKKLSESLKDYEPALQENKIVILSKKTIDLIDLILNQKTFDMNILSIKSECNRRSLRHTFRRLKNKWIYNALETHISNLESAGDYEPKVNREDLLSLLLNKADATSRKYNVDGKSFYIVEYNIKTDNIIRDYRKLLDTHNIFILSHDAITLLDLIISEKTVDTDSLKTHASNFFEIDSKNFWKAHNNLLTKRVLYSALEEYVNNSKNPAEESASTDAVLRHDSDIIPYENLVAAAKELSESEGMIVELNGKRYTLFVSSKGMVSKIRCSHYEKSDYAQQGILFLPKLSLELINLASELTTLDVPTIAKQLGKDYQNVYSAIKRIKDYRLYEILESSLQVKQVNNAISSNNFSSPSGISAVLGIASIIAQYVAATNNNPTTDEIDALLKSAKGLYLRQAEPNKKSS